MKVKYSDSLCELLKSLGYSKCFYVAGGNIMHLLESANKVFECIPFIHEVSAGIAAEYHNEAIDSEKERAFVLVTAGPGLTNLITAISGSYLESRDLLIIGGQVKSTDLKSGEMRQRGIQEIDGVSIVQSITKAALRLEKKVDLDLIYKSIKRGLTQRKGPVFIEVCLDVQAMNSEHYTQSKLKSEQRTSDSRYTIIESSIKKIVRLLSQSKRPVLLLGGEVTRAFMKKLENQTALIKIPIMTTWNAADRIQYDQENFFGRPDTWGMRYSNVLLQQADLVLAVGARLSLQQTGFNYKDFIPKGQIVHIFSDESEFEKGLDNVVMKIPGSADMYLKNLLSIISSPNHNWSEWLNFCRYVKTKLPLSEKCNKPHEGFWNPYEFYLQLSDLLGSDEALIPSSSGGAETVAMQSFKQNNGVRIITTSSLASMGYGLAGAIGTSILTNKKVCLVEGDGGFCQNLQELGTVERQSLNLKIFLFCNEGYASIKATQRNYFNGNYIGCDRSTGLGLPDWGALFEAYQIRCMVLNANERLDLQMGHMWSDENPSAFLVPIHPDQTYFPKITSRVLKDGSMESDALHNMTPELDLSIKTAVLRYI